MLVYLKTMFGRYYCIKSLPHLKTLENASKSSFLYYYNTAQKHEGFVGFEKNPFHCKDLRHHNMRAHDLIKLGKPRLLSLFLNSLNKINKT